MKNHKNKENEELEKNFNQSPTENNDGKVADTDTATDNADNDAANAEANEETPADNSIEKQLADAKELIANLQDKYLRQAAEFDNYRKRIIKEKADLILNGGEKTISAILPTIDDFDLAIKHMDKTDDVESLKKGVELIQQKLMKALESQGLKKIDAVGADFNVDFHEAIAFIPAPSDDMKGKVIDCVQAGYTLNDKVIRYAKVAVGQ